MKKQNKNKSLFEVVSKNEPMKVYSLDDYVDRFIDICIEWLDKCYIEECKEIIMKKVKMTDRQKKKFLDNPLKWIANHIGQEIEVKQPKPKYKYYIVKCDANECVSQLVFSKGDGIEPFIPNLHTVLTEDQMYSLESNDLEVLHKVHKLLEEK